MISMSKIPIQYRSLFTSCLSYGPIQNRIEGKLQDTLKFAPKIKPSGPKQVCVLGGGSWGTAVANLISRNSAKHADYFCRDVHLYVRNADLSKQIQSERYNSVYLPDIKLEKNLIAKSGSLVDTLITTNVIIFAVPNEFIFEVCQQIFDFRNSLPKDVIAISLIKGLSFDSNGNFERISQVIERMLAIPTGVLSGANVANEVAQRQYCEATLCFPDCDDSNLSKEHLYYLYRLFEDDYFKINISQDQPTVEFCGALKNVIACGAGLIDGLDFGINTKSSAIGAGIREMMRFIELFHPNFQLETLFQSCGLPDILASSFGGRNRKVGDAFSRSQIKGNVHETLESLERRLLKGQKLQGPSTAKCVYQVLSKAQLVHQFPFFTAVHKIFNENQKPESIFEAIRQC